VVLILSVPLPGPPSLASSCAGGWVGCPGRCTCGVSVPWVPLPWPLATEASVDGTASKWRARIAWASVNPRRGRGDLSL